MNAPPRQDNGPDCAGAIGKTSHSSITPPDGIIRPFLSPVQADDRPRFEQEARRWLGWIAYAGELDGVDTIGLWDDPAATARDADTALRILREYQGDAVSDLDLAAVRAIATFNEYPEPGLLGFTLAAAWFDNMGGDPFEQPSHDRQGRVLAAHIEGPDGPTTHAPMPPTTRKPWPAGGPFATEADWMRACIKAAVAEGHVDAIQAAAATAQANRFEATGTTRNPETPPMTAPKQELIVNLIDRLRADPPAPEFLWHRAAVGVVNLLGGNGGSGKSTVALGMAACAAAGRDLYGMQTKRQIAGFYSCEDGERVLLHGLGKICRAFSIDPATLEGRLHLFDMTDSEDPVLFRDGSATPRFEWLRQAVQTMDIELLIVDGASDAFDGNENVRREVRAFVRLLGKLGCTVILIAHLDKQAARGNGGDQNYSGSTAWNNSVRSRLVLLPNTDGTMALTHEKSNYGPKQPPIQLTWVNAVPMPASGPGFTGQDPTIALLALIQEFDERGEYIGTATNSTTNAHRLLSKEPDFPKQLSRADVFYTLRQAERAGHIRNLEYKSHDRKAKKRWILTDAGKALIAPSVRQVPEA